MSKVIELGLDGISPDLIGMWSEHLPNLMQMQKEGIWGQIKSVVPPIAYVTWAAAQTGRNPGEYGFWDYTYRDDFSYGQSKAVHPKSIKSNTLYKLLPLRGLKVGTINLPLTWPPPRIPGGYSISYCVTETLEQGYTWPKTLEKEVGDLIGEYILDSVTPSSLGGDIDLEETLYRIIEMDKQRFTLLKYFIEKKQCDYLVTVANGAERLAQFFYRYLDRKHKRYEDNKTFAGVLKDHYKLIDEVIGEIRRLTDDQTVLFVHSNSGIQRLDGLFNLNEWLHKEGYLNLRSYPSKPAELKDLDIEWSKTMAWASGSNGALYLNMKERESEGVVTASDYDHFLDRLITELSQLRDENDNTLKPFIFRRKEINNGSKSMYGPDLSVFFNNGAWRTNEIVGSKELYLTSSPWVLDDSTNSLYGYFCLAGHGIPANGEEQNVSLLDITPTIMNLLGEAINEDLEGKPIVAAPEEIDQGTRDSTTFIGY